MLVETVAGLSVPDDVVLTSSEMHVRAILGPPWSMKLPVGVPNDKAAGNTTVCGYLNMFRLTPTCRWVLVWDEAVSGERTLAGFTCGRAFDDFLLDETKMKRLCANGTDDPRVGEYYFALTTIQGPEGAPGRDYRGRRILGRSLFSWSVEILVACANDLDCARFWVRTHAAEQKVQKVCQDLGCIEFARQDIDKGDTVTQRVVMVKPKCQKTNAPITLAGPWIY